MLYLIRNLAVFIRTTPRSPPQPPPISIYLIPLARNANHHPKMKTRPEHQRYKNIFLFWLPLEVTWLMMALEGSFLSAVIARLAEAKFNLAAFGVAFAITLFIEAPVLMLVSASNSLVRDWQAYHENAPLFPGPDHCW